MDARKIQLVGGRSYAISLPKEWIRRHNLKSKDLVYFSFDHGDSLAMSAKPSERLKKTVELDINSVDLIRQLLFLCYVKNVDVIKFHSTKIPHEKAKEVRETLKYLEGYDITNESESMIEISFLFKEINISLPRIVQRMVYMLNTMRVSLENDDFSSIEEMETNLDKLSHMSNRIIFGCMTSVEQRNSNNIYHIEDLFFMKDIIKKLENIGDLIYDFKNIKFSSKDLESMRNILSVVDNIIFKNVYPPKSKDKKNAVLSTSKNADYMLRRMSELARDVCENIIAIEFHKEYFKN